MSVHGDTEGPAAHGMRDIPGAELGNILNNPQVFRLFLDSVDKRIDQSIRQRTTRSWNLILAVLAVTATLLTGLFGFFYGEIGETFEKTAEKTARNVVEFENAEWNRRLDELQFDTDVTSLNFDVLRLDSGDSFSVLQATSIIETIEALYKNAPDEISRKRLLFSVETAAKNFAAANRIDFVEILGIAAPDLLLESDVALQAMILVLGHRLLADAGAPRSWLSETGSMKETYRRYREYADRATISGYPELYLVHEMLIGYLEERPEAEVSNLVRDTENLNEIDSKAFRKILTSLVTEDVNELPGSERVLERTHAFLCKYRESGSLLKSVYVELGLVCPSQPGG